MPYTTEALVMLTYAHFLIFLVPAMGLGISLLREDRAHRRELRKDAAIHHVMFGDRENKTAA